jgi:hypothetical protein
MTQTAFGQTFTALGLDPAKGDTAVLETQIDAYGKFVAAQLAAGGVTLPASPATDEDKFHWIQNLASIQRQGLSDRINVQIIFARELIQVLNTGFIWQDPASGETLSMAKEPSPIDPSKFLPDGVNWFKELSLGDPLPGDIDDYPFLTLTTVPSGEFVNKPKRIEIIHCPMTLSACLELQSRSGESQVQLAAHYVIPPLVSSSDGAADKNLNQVLQVAHTNQALILTDDTGQNVPVEDAIVIMLVGESGKAVNGARMPAIPTWFTDAQLRAMGQLVNDACTLLAQNDKTVNRDQCMSTTGDLGVRFHYQNTSEEYRWGDIADYDPTIFDAYVKNPGGLNMAVAFDFAQSVHQFKAGADIPLKILYDSSARVIELERLGRCPTTNKVVWEPVRNEEVDGSATSSTYDEKYFDSGPNSDGDQFFRVRVYDQNGVLTGWSIDQAYLTGFAPAATFASQEECDPTGT